MIYIELLRRNYKVSVSKSSANEIDFVAVDGIINMNIRDFLLAVKFCRKILIGHHIHKAYKAVKGITPVCPILLNIPAKHKVNTSFFQNPLFLLLFYIFFMYNVIIDILEKEKLYEG
jgi:hypothetical protein